MGREWDSGAEQSVEQDRAPLPRAPRIAVVAAADLQRHTLQNLLRDDGFEIAWSGPPADLANAAGCIDAWLVDAGGLDEDAVDALLEHSDAPLLISEPMPPQAAYQSHRRWRQRLLSKLEEVAVKAEASGAGAAPDAVWVLAASTGGPEAVRRFLAVLPPLPLALLYAQHIDPKFDLVLADALASTSWPMLLCSGETRLVAGRVLVAPAERQIQLLAFDRVVATRQLWPGPYRPGINHIAAQVARQYRAAAGLIVFSGLCDDGAVGARVMQASGGTVWVQQPEDCIAPAMPEAALATGCVSFTGSPEQLAAALVQRYANSASDKTAANNERVA